MTPTTHNETGVYQIKNLVSGKVYVGSSKALTKRWKIHLFLLRKGCHHSRKLQYAWNKYGESAFVFTPLLYCAEKDLIFFEQRAIDGFNSYVEGYNGRPVAESCLGTKQTSEHIAKRSAKRFGVPMTPEAIANRTASRRANGNFEYSDEYKEKMSNSLKRAYETTDLREKVVAGLHKRYEDPRAREIQAEGTRKRFEDPAYRAENAELMRSIRPNKKGRSYEEMYGPERAAEIRAKQASKLTGQKRKPYNNGLHTRRWYLNRGLEIPLELSETKEIDNNTQEV